MSEAYQRIPCGVFDTTGNEKDAIVLYGWIVDGQLDSHRLSEAWWALAAKWPVVVARLQRDWVYNVPTEEEVGVLKAKEDAKAPDDKSRTFLIRDMRQSGVHDVLKFAVGAQLPQDRISVEKLDDNMDIWGCNSATSVAQLMREDRAQISVQVTLFSDATTISISTPHVLCDGVGAKEIADAWCTCIHGRADELKPLSHLGSDAFASLASSAQEPPRPPGWRTLGMLGLIQFGFHFLLDMYRRPSSAIENRAIFVPKQVIEQLKKQAIDELKREDPAPRQQDHDDLWVSSSDVLAAWIIKHAHADKKNDQSILSVLYPSNLRWLGMGDKIDPLPRPYVQNAALTITLPELPASEMVSKLSLGQLALLFRRSLEAQTQPDAVVKSLTWRKWSRGKTSVFFGPGSHWFLITNWRKLGMYDLDFGSGPNKILRTWGYAYHPVPMRNSAGLVANDPSGGVWMGAFLSRDEWRSNFGEYLQNADGGEIHSQKSKN